jgi:cytochrome c oxidase assembly factor CtaG
MPLLHSGHDVSLTAWHFEPTVVGIALAVLGLYGLALRAGGPLEWWRPLAFLAGASLMVVALVSPLDAASDRLLSMHMLQHVVLTSIGPPLVLLGLPPGALRRLLPAGSRGFRLLGLLTFPFLTAAAFIVNMWLWHIPPLYEAALSDIYVHVAMHVAFMASGLLFWWPIVAPHPELATALPGARLLYLFVSGFPMGVLALLLLSSEVIIYDFYEGQPDRLWNLSALEDQQIAGVVMGSLGEIASFVAFSLIFVRYFLSDDEELAAAARDQLPHNA